MTVTALQRHPGLRGGPGVPTRSGRHQRRLRADRLRSALRGRSPTDEPQAPRTELGGGHGRAGPTAESGALGDRTQACPQLCRHCHRARHGEAGPVPEGSLGNSHPRPAARPSHGADPCDTRSSRRPEAVIPQEVTVAHSQTRRHVCAAETVGPRTQRAPRGAVSAQRTAPGLETRSVHTAFHGLGSRVALRLRGCVSKAGRHTATWNRAWGLAVASHSGGSGITWPSRVPRPL